MKHFKKAILVTVVFVLITAVISTVSITAYFNNESDRQVREEFSGELDYLVVGASHGLRAFVPGVMDENLGCSSYNLSGALMTFNGREALLYEELERSEIKTVVFEISYNALTRPISEIEGDLHVVPRLAEAKDRAAYFFNNIDGFHWDLPYSYYFTNGTLSLLKSIRGSAPKSAAQSKKGYSPLNAVDLTLSESEAKEIHNSISNETEINKENLEVLERMLAALEKEGAEVIFAVTPVSNACIWEADNWDTFYSDLKDLSRDYNVKMYDFNLLKNRYELFNDKTSFFDNYHLSDEGAKTFSQEYCKVIKEAENKSVDSLFYESYAEMKNDSPYNK